MKNHQQGRTHSEQFAAHLETISKTVSQMEKYKNIFIILKILQNRFTIHVI